MRGKLALPTDVGTRSLSWEQGGILLSTEDPARGLGKHHLRSLCCHHRLQKAPPTDVSTPGLNEALSQLWVWFQTLELGLWDNDSCQPLG